MFVHTRRRCLKLEAALSSLSKPPRRVPSSHTSLISTHYNPLLFSFLPIFFHFLLLWMVSVLLHFLFSSLRSLPLRITSRRLICCVSLSLSFKLTCNVKKNGRQRGKKLNAFNKWLTSNRLAFQTLPIHSPMKGEKSFTRRDKAE